MNISILVKKQYAAALNLSGFVRRRIRKKAGHNAVILMYHRVIDMRNATDRLQAGMVVHPETFDHHVRYLLQNFDVASIDTLSRMMRGERRNEQGKPICVLTFDDGWSDFYKNAFPILKRYGVPGTVFLTTGFVGTDDSFWTDKLARMFYKREEQIHAKRNIEKSSNLIVDLMENGGGSAENRLERSIELMKSRRQEEINGILSILSERWQEKSLSTERDFLTWNEVREMHRSGLVSFGSHTESHRILTTLDEREIEEELERSKNRLLDEGVADPASLAFAYPNGDYNDHIAESVERQEYRLAVTTRKGWIDCHESGGLFELKRIGIHQDMSLTQAMFACRILQII